MLDRSAYIQAVLGNEAPVPPVAGAGPGDGPAEGAVPAEGLQEGGSK